MQSPARKKAKMGLVESTVQVISIQYIPEDLDSKLIEGAEFPLGTSSTSLSCRTTSGSIVPDPKPPTRQKKFNPKDYTIKMPPIAKEVYFHLFVAFYVPRWRSHDPAYNAPSTFVLLHKSLAMHALDLKNTKQIWKTREYSRAGITLIKDGCAVPELKDKYGLRGVTMEEFETLTLEEYEEKMDRILHRTSVYFDLDNKPH